MSLPYSMPEDVGTVSQVTALAHRGCEDPAGRDGPGLGEQQTLFGGEGQASGLGQGLVA